MGGVWDVVSTSHLSIGCLSVKDARQGMAVTEGGVETQVRRSHEVCGEGGDRAGCRQCTADSVLCVCFKPLILLAASEGD